MAYLITQIIFCLLITALISFNIGWLLRGLRDRDQNTFHKTPDIKNASNINSLSNSSTLLKKEVYETKTKAPTISHKIEKIQGIGRGTKISLRNIKIKTTIDLINKCLSEKGFLQVISTTQVIDSTVMQWVSMADLMRVPDIDGHLAELIEASEIKSVHDLANANADELRSIMKTVNQSKHKISLPDIHRVTNWIRDAKSIVKRN